MRKIPYGKQCIDEDDILAVAEALRSDYLTCGPRVEEFEKAIAEYCGVDHAVAVSNGTAALHTAMHALGIGPSDEVIVPTMTFAASANAVLYCGAKPVFVDVDKDTLLISPELAEAAITPATKAIVGVDYAGQPCDWKTLRKIADKRGIQLIADSCHSIGAQTHEGNRSGSFADVNIFSFHPVKHIATGEGGMILTQDESTARKMRQFRSHGITTDARQRENANSWHYEMVELGYNYRITDIQCALGTSQLKKLPAFLDKRKAIAKRYDEAFAGTAVTPLSLRPGIRHAYHLYVVKVANRNEIFKKLRELGIGVQVHYIPVHLHPYYQERHGTFVGQLPAAEAAFQQILSLPIFPLLSERDQDYVIKSLMHMISE